MLWPKISNNIPCEKLHLSVKLSVLMLPMKYLLYVVSTCAYGNTPDKLKQNDVWNEKLTELENNGVQQKDIELYKKNWFIHDSKRVYIEDSFDFSIETIGI